MVSSNVNDSAESLLLAIASFTTAGCALFINWLYLHCFIADRKLHCIFNAILANQAFVDLIFSVAVIVFNVNLILATESNTDGIVCEVYLVMIFLVHTQTLLLLLIVAYDRVKLISGVLQYRHFMTTKIANTLIGCSWLATATFTVLRVVYMSIVKGVPNHPQGLVSNETVYECRKGFAKVDWGTGVELGLVLILVLSFCYVLYRFKRSQAILTSIQLYDTRKNTIDEDMPRPSNLPRLSARDSIIASASMRYASPITMSVTHEDVDTHSPANMEGNYLPKEGDWHATLKANEMLTSCSDAQYDFHKARRSVAFDHSSDMHTDTVTKNQPGISPNIQPGSDYCTTSSSTNGSNPWVLQLLPFFSSPQSFSSWRSDSKAAQQLGLLMLVVLMCLTPQLITRVVVAARGQDIPQIWFHLFLWLAHLRSIIFPFIYCKYSPRLRSHFVRHICLCQWHFKKVFPKTTESHIEMYRHGKEHSECTK